MTTPRNETALLEIRIAAVEADTRRMRRENRLLKSALALTAAAFCGVIMLGAAVASRQDADLGKVTATRVSIVDENGKELLTLGKGDKGYGIQVLGSDGKKEIGMGVGNDGRSSGLAIFDAQGKARIGLGMDGAVPSMAVTDENGKKVIALGVGTERHGVAVFDANETLRGALAMGPNGPVICLNDEKGAPCAAIGRHEDGSFGLSTAQSGTVPHPSK